MGGKRNARSDAGNRRTPRGSGRPGTRAGGAAKKSASRPAKKTTRKAAAKPAKAAAAGARGKTGKTGKPPRTLGGKIRRVLFYLFIVGMVGLIVGTGTFIYLYKTTDLPDPNADFETNTTFVYYSNGTDEIGRFAIQNRTQISYEEMPQHLKDATVAAENRTFWTDSGIDFKGIMRAVLNNAQGNSTQGGSTITQEYIKVLYLTQERSYSRKLKEAILALKLGRQVSKREILEGYLNTVYFGRGAYGVQAAAQAYFRKDAADLDLRESAVLAAVLNSPNRLDPENGKEARKALRSRVRYVLSGMAEIGAITSDEAEKAGRRLPKFPKQVSDNRYGGQRGHVLTMVKNELTRLTNAKTGQPFTEGEIEGGGLRVTTTFTKKAMDAAAEGVAEVRPEGEEFTDKDLHVAVASVDVKTGAVRGIFAGQDFLDSQINWAVAGGQAGSTVKPFSLAAGLKAGFSLKDTFAGNTPFTLENGDEVRNEQDHDYGTAVNLIKATEQSINTAFVDLTMSIPDGPNAVLKMMNAMGIPPNKGPGKHYGFPRASAGLDPYPSITLGSATISPINMANAYATIANEGRFHEPFIIEKVESLDGDVLYDHKVSDKQAIDPELGPDIAADVSYAMQQVVKTGTGRAALGLGRPAAGKTGTATNGLDQVSSAWFAGFTPQMSTAVMYVRGKGNEQLDGWLPSYFGGSYPANTWTAVMKRNMEGVEVEDFPPPAWVDGEAPTPGHAPTTRAPSPTKTPKPTRTPDRPTKPTKIPTRDPDPTTDAPPPPPETTTVDPTQPEPPPDPTTTAPPPDPSDTPPATTATPPAPPASRVAGVHYAAVSTTSRRAYWNRMRW